MQDIVIVAATRTAVGKFGGSIANIPATDLGALVVKEVIARAKLDGAQIGEVIIMVRACMENTMPDQNSRLPTVATPSSLM